MKPNIDKDATYGFHSETKTITRKMKIWLFLSFFFAKMAEFLIKRLKRDVYLVLCVIRFAAHDFCSDNIMRDSIDENLAVFEIFFCKNG